jgi:hypothetical protein
VRALPLPCLPTAQKAVLVGGVMVLGMLVGLAFLWGG